MQGYIEAFNTAKENIFTVMCVNKARRHISKEYFLLGFATRLSTRTIQPVGLGRRNNTFNVDGDDLG